MSILHIRCHRHRSCTYTNYQADSSRASNQGSRKGVRIAHILRPFWGLLSSAYLCPVFISELADKILSEFAALDVYLNLPAIVAIEDLIDKLASRNLWRLLT